MRCRINRIDGLRGPRTVPSVRLIHKSLLCWWVNRIGPVALNLPGSEAKYTLVICKYLQCHQQQPCNELFIKKFNVFYNFHVFVPLERPQNGIMPEIHENIHGFIRLT